MHHAASRAAAGWLPILWALSVAAGGHAQQRVEQFDLRQELGAERGAEVEESLARGVLRDLVRSVPAPMAPVVNRQRGGLVLRSNAEQQWLRDALVLLADGRDLELRVQLTVVSLPAKALRDLGLKPGTPKVVAVPEVGALLKSCRQQQGRFWNLRDIAVPLLRTGELPRAALPSTMPPVSATAAGIAVAEDAAVVLPRIVGDGRMICDVGSAVRLRVGEGALICAIRGTRTTVLWVQLAALVPAAAPRGWQQAPGRE